LKWRIQAREVTPHICDLICAMVGYFCACLSLRRSQSLMMESTEPTAMYLELWEKAQLLREQGFSLGLG
jgi:hypothetical protein